MNGLYRERHGLQARRTHHVHSKRRHGHRQPEPQANLAGDVHALAGPDDIAENDTVDLREIESRQGSFASGDCQIHRRIIRQGSGQFSLRRAPGGDYANLTAHNFIPSVKARTGMGRTARMTGRKSIWASTCFSKSIPGASSINSKPSGTS